MAPPFLCTIEVRFSDLDLYGHVNNVTFFAYLETARVKMFENFFKEMTEKGTYLLVAHAECDYLEPILLGDRVNISAVISRVGTTSFDIDYRIFNDDEKTYATARTVMVCFDTIGKVAVPVPACIRAAA
jgi:acyl-CoA thioester hydrolase